MHEIVRKIKFIAGCILRPRYTYFRFREWNKVRDKHQPHPDIDLENLPEVELTHVTEDRHHKQILLKLFRDNPSPLVLTPRNIEYLEIELRKGVEYYLISGSKDEVVGVLGYKPEQSMPGRLIIEYGHRGKGYGISAMKKLEKIKAGQGLKEFWGQVYKNNTRMLNLMLSLGYGFVEDKETEDYFIMVKSLTEETEDNDSST